MNALRYRFLLWIALLCPAIAHAQHEYDVWHFGFGAGIDFRGGSPVLLENTPSSTIEGCAVMCDRRSGELLFSTDGDNVYNRNGKLMLNGSGLLGGKGTSLQAALIIPMPCNPEKYYLFTADFEGYTQPTNKGIHYSVIDMTLDGGLGRVTEKNVPLLPKASERQTAVMHANGHDYWVLVHSLGGRTFYAFKVSAEGVDPTPVISVAGMDQGNPPQNPNTTIGCLEISPTGRKIALTGYLEGWPPNPHFGSLVELYDFDPATGRVSNSVPLVEGVQDPGSIEGFKSFGVSFSPDGSRLYAGGPPLLQWSLDVDDPAAIRASKTMVSDTAGNPGIRWIYRSMQVGPDGRIYLNQGNSYVGVITNPNAKGKACGLIDTAYQFKTLVSPASLGLPNNIDDRAFFARPSAFPRQVRIDSVLQPTPCSPAVVSASDGFIQYEWSNGHTGRTVSLDRSGRYVVTAIDSNGCRSMTDVVVSAIEAPLFDIRSDGPLRFCQGRTVRLAAHGGFQSYLWSTGATTQLITVDRPGTYIATATTRDGCVLHDTAIVQVDPSATVHVRYGENISGSPGDIVTIPVILEQPLDDAIVQSMDLSLGYDPEMMSPLLPRLSGASATAELELSMQGTLTSGWNLQILNHSPGTLTLRLTAPAGMNFLKGTGELVRLRFTTFVHQEDMGQSTLTAELPLSLDIGERPCLDLQTISGRIELGFCGSSSRRMIMGLDNYAFDGIVPNPFAKATEFRFRLGLDGDTKLEVFDQSGGHIATVLEGHLPAGYHAIKWDATGVPSGLYQYRLTSSTWTASGQMVILQ